MVYPSWIWPVLLVAAIFFLHQAECVRNGELVQDVNEFKYIVGLDMSDGPSGRRIPIGRCGGAILDDYHILTAAHCIVKKSGELIYPSKVKIRLHTLKNNDSMLQMKRYAEKLYVPNTYLQNHLDEAIHESDIAVIKVKKSMNLAGNSRKLQSLELPEANHLTDGDQGVFAGYGVYDFEFDAQGHSTPLSDVRLRKFNFQVVGDHLCPTPEAQRIRTIMCVRPYPPDRNKKQGPCNGDSGSPLVVKTRSGKLIVIGVCSSGDGGKADECNSYDASAYFTRVNKFLNWIRNAMKGESDVSDTTVHEMGPGSPRGCFW